MAKHEFLGGKSRKEKKINDVSVGHTPLIRRRRRRRRKPR
jgi:hypothetical protein